MPGLEIRPFRDDDLDDAAVLLAARHARHRAAEPLLPEYGHDGLRGQIDEAWRAEHTAGAAALRDGTLVGYMIGRCRTEGHWAGHAWVGPAGHAAEDPEVVRDLYASLAGDWVEAGYTRHVAVVPALDDDLDPWYRVSFGQQHAHAVRDTSIPPAVEAGLHVREGRPEELDAAVPLLLILPEHLARSPVFSAAAPPSAEEMRSMEAEWLAEPNVAFFLAERDGRAIGYAAVGSETRRDLTTPENTAVMGIVNTEPGVRGTGAGLALTRALLEWARDRGHTTMVSDWRVTNLGTDRFWRSRGWRPTFLRLYRSIP